VGELGLMLPRLLFDPQALRLRLAAGIDVDAAADEAGELAAPVCVGTPLSRT
jgi:hypothetical protein